MAGFMWDSYEELKKIEERMNRLLSEGSGQMRGDRWNQMPNIDVQEHDNNVIVTADMPGLDKKDININVRNGNLLEISARKKTGQEKKERGYIRHERAYAGYYRTITLPAIVDQTMGKASYNNGVLEITLPIAQEAWGSNIPIS